MGIESYIRSLARSSYWQEIYRSSKECHGIHIFDNNTNISGIQYMFLYWLRVYNLLLQENSERQWQNLDHDVIKDNIRCDAFLYWRTKEIDKQLVENKKAQKKQNTKKGQKDFKIYKGKQ